MKIPVLFALLLLSALALHLGHFTLAPSDVQAAFAWNLTLVLAPVLALAFQWKMAQERKFSVPLFLTLLAVVNTALVLGSRAGAWNLGDWARLLGAGALPEHPGKTVLGGLSLAILVFVLLRRWWRFPLDMADNLVIGLPLAGAIARIGCLTAGCCYGMMTGTEHGICYGPGAPAFEQQVSSGLIAADAAQSLPVYPVQYFLLVGNILIFMVLWRLRNRFRQPGALLFLGLALLTAQRFGWEFIRDVATNRGTFGAVAGGLKVAQWVSLLLSVLALFGFWAVLRQKVQPPRVPRATLGQLAAVMGGIGIGTLLLHEVLTLDEQLMILLSSLPAMLVIGQRLWAERRSGQNILAASVMLSGTAIVLLASPVDSTRKNQLFSPNKQWLELGVGGAYGNYQDISRDCDGNIVRRDIIKYQSLGLDLSSNWQDDDVFLRAGLRGAFGSARPDNPDLTSHHYNYSSYGIYGKVSYRWIGFSLGAFNRRLDFGENQVGKTPEISFQPSGTLRIGPADRYSVDFRVFDEPTLGFSNVPIFSMGMFNWGFDDPSGSKFLRGGFALTDNGESAFHMAGRFPLGARGIYGDISTYLGGVNMVQLGLRFRFKEMDR